ncbi:MAG: glycosyltransferase family 4 protein [Saccharolobus sp.]|uniref:glycosyltransferase family 4 protein n=1 Tax=Saccharolobus sp. TaxID=2100761 RepID=UPI00317432C6
MSNYSMRVLALTPSFFGSTGDAVNERQLLMTLAKKVGKCYIVTFIGFKQIFTKRRAELKIAIPKNILLIPLPLPHVHILVTYLVMAAVSCFISIIVLMLNVLKKIDLVYIRTSPLSIGFLTFHSLARKTIVKIPAIIEDEIPDRGITKFLIEKIIPFMDRLVLSKARRVAVNSKSLYDALVRRRRFKHKDRPLETPPGVNLNLIQKIKSQTDNTFLQNVIKVGYVGSLSWWQGTDILVQAVALLKKRLSNLKLVIIGDGELRLLIEEMCKALDITHEITGFLPHEEALRRFAMLDVLVLPSKKMTTTESNIPIKVIEAWALGIPVILTKRRVFLEYGIRGFEDVIYCEPQPLSIANAILTLLNDPSLRKKLKINGFKLATRFDYDKIVQNLLRAIE